MQETQLSGLMRFLDTIVDRVSSALRNALLDDEPETEPSRRPPLPKPTSGSRRITARAFPTPRPCADLGLEYMPASFDVIRTGRQTRSSALCSRVVQEKDREPAPADMDWRVVVARDAARRKRVREIIKDAALRTGEDFERAACVFQHGETPEDILMAHVLARTDSWY
jgi:hypothetical protein